jgi:hypothetical protein
VQATVLLMWAALSSLGCDIPTGGDVPKAPALGGARQTQAPASEPAPAPTPAVAAFSYPANFGETGRAEHSIGAVLHATVMSFFCGHDDVRTAQEIESATYAGAYSGQSGYPPSLAATLTWSEP